VKNPVLPVKDRKSLIRACTRLTLPRYTTYHSHSMATDSRPLGQTVSHYRILRKIGGGKASYNDFLTIWSDADPDIPVVKQAKAECANLQ
jgi:hypothetical protein